MVPQAFCSRRRRNSTLWAGTMMVLLCWLLLSHYTDTKGKQTLRARVLQADTEEGLHVGTMDVSKSEPKDPISPPTNLGGTPERNPPLDSPSTSPDPQGNVFLDGGPWNANSLAVEYRCEWLANQFERHTAWMSPEGRRQRFHHQAGEVGIYYRATSHIFWVDFVQGGWSATLLSSLLPPSTNRSRSFAAAAEGPKIPTPVTWVSGDQHLGNFGAYHYYAPDKDNDDVTVVFGMNDFDEAAIDDFQVDVTRLAVSIWDQAMGGSKLSPQEARQAIQMFTTSYLEEVNRLADRLDDSYDEMMLLDDATTKWDELTPEMTRGRLQIFLKGVQESHSAKAQLKKFTHKVKGDASGRREFKKGTLEQPKHKLAPVSIDLYHQIREVLVSEDYHATRVNAQLQNDTTRTERLEVLDVAARIGSGVGSFGVARYYALVLFNDGCQGADPGASIHILDIKYQSPASFKEAKPLTETTWYNQAFETEAARVSEAQHCLTLVPDPFLGWIQLVDENGESKSFTVRERSPWKEKMDLNTLASVDEFYKFVQDMATATASSHVHASTTAYPRATPKTDTFAHAIQTLLKNDQENSWGDAMADLAAGYHNQVQIDFECFQDYVHTEYP